MKYMGDLVGPLPRTRGQITKKENLPISRKNIFNHFNNDVNHFSLPFLVKLRINGIGRGPVTRHLGKFDHCKKSFI